MVEILMMTTKFVQGFQVPACNSTCEKRRDPRCPFTFRESP
jgi:hypothetical protein